MFYISLRKYEAVNYVGNRVALDWTRRCREIVSCIELIPPAICPQAESFLIMARTDGKAEPPIPVAPVLKQPFTSAETFAKNR